MVMMMMANLSFVLLKINDTDIGQLQAEQRDTPAAAAAINLLLTATDSENIVLQLKRKSCWSGDNSIGVNDEEGLVEINKKICYLKIQQQQQNVTDKTATSPTANVSSSSSLSSGPEIVVSLHLPNSLSAENYASSKSTQTDDMAYYVHEQLRNIQKDTERLIDEEHNLFEQSLAPEIDIEEITLRKTHSHERLGLTVCYSNGEEYGESGGGVGSGSGGVGGDGSGGSAGGSGNEVYGVGTGVTEVYISDIHVDSVAGRDGRLRQGDQILQINGKDITTREETETLIAENNNAVTLLISRYLYGEDDFNDPSTNEDDDEVLVVEDDEDDDDEEEFYDENNMTYVNCMASNDCCINNVDDFDKALMSQVEQQQQHQQHEPILDVGLEGASNNVGVTNTVTTLHKDKMRNSKSEKRFSNSMRNSQVNTTIANPALETHTNKVGSSTVAAKTVNAVTDNKTSDYYESEHIYETIPEDPESEPFYCSPYDSSVYVTAIASCSSSTVTDAALQQQMQQHKQRVVQWLGINPSHGICQTALPRHSIRSSSGCGRSLKNRHKTNSASVGTMRSTVTSLTNGSMDGIGSAMTLPASQIDDQDNSSSAYNTGGSNNSVSPHSLVLNAKGRTGEAYHSNAGCLPLTSTASADDVLAMQQQLMMQHKLVSQQKVLSPKDKNKITSPKSSNKLPTMELAAMATSGKSPNMFAANNEANVQRNIMVQQHLLKQTLTLDKVAQQPPPPYYQHQQQHQQQTTTTGAADQLHCPQFTAPNLSQYHFVSSQEVNNLSLNNKIPKSSPTVAETANNNNAKKNDGGEGGGGEEAMVWKVKRRPDGTRYIVRRPAKSRPVIKERSVRLNVERLRDDITTTEDDTMSEIKTGRYWTREERKKHIEKAKERRQQQQLQYQQQLQNQLQQKAPTTHYDETGSSEHQQQQEREQQRQANFLSFSRQKYRQHYQLQFNSAQAEAAQKQRASLNYHNATTLPSNAHDDGSTGGIATEQTDVVVVATTSTSAAVAAASSNLPTSSSERNNLSGNMISVTTV